MKICKPKKPFLRKDGAVTQGSVFSEFLCLEMQVAQVVAAHATDGSSIATRNSISPWLRSPLARASFPFRCFIIDGTIARPRPQPLWRSAPRGAQSQR